MLAVISYMDVVAGVWFPTGGIHAVATGLAAAADKGGVRLARPDHHPSLHLGIVVADDWLARGQVETPDHPPEELLVILHGWGCLRRRGRGPSSPALPR
jgi:hypothetical protein